MNHAVDSTKRGSQSQSPDRFPCVTPSREPRLDAVIRFQRQVGNQAVLAMLRASTIRTKLEAGNPGDPAEEEADTVAERVMRMPALSMSQTYNARYEAGEAPPFSLMSTVRSSTPATGDAPDTLREVLRSPGAPLDAVTRSFFEPRFGRDFSRVRIHTDSLAASSAREIGAQAYASGRHLVFAEGRYDPGNSTGRQLLAHELAHVASGHRGVHRDAGAADPVQGTKAGTATSTTPADAGGGQPAAEGGLVLIPPDGVRQPSERDILVARLGNQMVVLPAAGSILVPRAPAGAQAQPEGRRPPENLFALPTVGKEGLVAVSVGGRAGFMLDAGGSPAIVFPAGIAAIQEALGITSLRGVAVTHIHSDHVQSFVRLVAQFQITPENLHFPAAFAVNPTAPGSIFANQLRAAQSDPALRALGHGPSARYGAIPSPTGSAFFKRTLNEGETTFDFFGLTDAFRELETQRTGGEEQPRADTASLLTRVTNERTGARWLYVGDLRGGDLTKFRQAMGDVAYTEMLSGVRIVVGLQHHLGALTSRADREGLTDLLARTYMQSGQLTVLAQSQEIYGAKQFVNRSLIEALTELGIDVHVALEPGAGGQVSTVTATTTGISVSGRGARIESHPGVPELAQQMQRLIQLREAEAVLTKYEQFLTEPGRQSAAVRAARVALEDAMLNFVRTAIGNVRAGAAGRQQAELENPAAQQAALARVREQAPIEAMLTPVNMAQLRDLDRTGPYRVIYEKELLEARSTGRMSDRGIEALWELEPQAARRLVGESALPRAESSRVISSLPGQPLPAATRATGFFLLAFEVFQQVAPLLQAEQARSFDENVGAGLNDIIWWQQKGVFPRVKALKTSTFGADEVTETEDSKRIQPMLNAKKIDYLVLLDIHDASWDAFTIWASTHLLNLLDWTAFISNAKAIRSQGPSVTEKDWQYRVASIERGRIYGHNIVERWEKSDRLTRILKTAAERMVATSEKQISQVAAQPGPYAGPAISSPQTYRSLEIYAGKPKASGRKQFNSGISNPTLYTLAGQYSRGGFDPAAEFYVFPNTASPGPVPSGYEVVGGADYNTYLSIVVQRNFVVGAFGYEMLIDPNRLEILLAKSADLRDAR